MDKPVKITSADVCAALKLRYPKEQHSLLFEVAPSTGGGTRYADAVAVGLWASHGHKIEGIEVKVSRSDFLNEMKQPEKSQPVFQFCDLWWLACPKDMVRPDELPKTWGLLELQSDGVLKVKVKAPRLEPRPITLAFFASLCRRMAGVDEEIAASMMQRWRQDLQEQLRRESDATVASRIGARLKEAETTMALIEKIKTETGIDFTSYRNKDLIETIKVVQELNVGWRGSLGSVLKEMAALAETIHKTGLVVTK